ncbi:hypothetical protein GCM10027436_71060 [Actinophytocola sediminis]
MDSCPSCMVPNIAVQLPGGWSTGWWHISAETGAVNMGRNRAGQTGNAAYQTPRTWVTCGFAVKNARVARRFVDDGVFTGSRHRGERPGQAWAGSIRGSARCRVRRDHHGGSAHVDSRTAR